MVLTEGRAILPPALRFPNDALFTLTSFWQQMKLLAICYFLLIQIDIVKEKLAQLTTCTEIPPCYAWLVLIISWSKLSSFREKQCWFLLTY